jgi:hypothetical protein
MDIVKRHSVVAAHFWGMAQTCQSPLARAAYADMACYHIEAAFI